MRRLVLIAVLVAGLAVVLPLPAAQAAGAWSVAHTGPNDDIYMGVDFLDPLWGWSVSQSSVTSSSPAEVIRTTDGGATWPAVTPAPSTAPDLEDIAAAGSYTAIAVGMANTVIRTTDMGVTWQAVGQLSPATVHADFWTIDYANSMRAFAGGDTYGAKGVDIIMTVDGGATWADRSPAIVRNGSSGQIGAVDFLDGAHGWAVVNVGRDVKLLSTTDAGVTWTARSFGVDTTARDVYFLDAQHGWVLAGYYDEHLWRTTDGGATWETLTLPDLFSPKTICFVSPTVGYMGTGEQGGAAPNANTVLWGTTDAGTTWSSVYSGPPGSWNYIGDIDFTDPDHGWASGVIGYNATVLKYTSADALPTPAPPTTVVSGVTGDGWYNADVTLLFESSIGFGGGWVKRIDWCLDLSTWGAGLGDILSETFYATADHAKDGVYPISFYATDSGNRVEPTKVITFGIDTVKPTTKGLYAASAKRGRAATLKYKVVDAAPCGPTARTVTIKVKNRAGKVVKTIKYANKSVNTPLTAKFTVPRTWKTGVYRFLVYATDNAGNAQAKVGSNRLTVK